MTARNFSAFPSAVSVSIFLLLISSFVEAQEVSVEISKGCVCPLNYDPVCGSDGKTYGNTCVFFCEAGPDVFLLRKGECDKDKLTIPKQPERCTCLQIYEPVCGSDGKTYSNSCEIKCQDNQDVVVVRKGECNEVPVTSSHLSPCACKKNYNPVCGSNGKTYGNRCTLNCARHSGVNVRIAKMGPCEK